MVAQKVLLKLHNFKVHSLLLSLGYDIMLYIIFRRQTAYTIYVPSLVVGGGVQYGKKVPRLGLDHFCV